MAVRRAAATSRRRVGLLVAALALVVTVSGIGIGVERGRSSAGADGSGTGPGSDSSTGAGGPSRQNPTTGQGPTNRQASAGGSVLPAGFSIKAGSPPAAAPVTTPVVTGDPLPTDVLAAILRRLPAFDGASDPGSDFRWPTQSLTKPPAGTTVTQTFPATGDSQNPPTAPSTTPSGPLTVLRMQPEGSVSVAPFVSITFSQPMVAVGRTDASGTVGRTDAQVPAVITPKIPGHWDWIGTQTLRFTADPGGTDPSGTDRLPMATRYTVTVPAGTKSTTGGILATAATATFDTPPPAVLSVSPDAHAPAGLHPVMVALFNQRVDPTAVLRSVTVTAGGAGWPVRVATQAEIDADRDATAALGGVPQGRAVALVPVKDFPAASSIVLTVKAGTPSAEGPLTSTADATFRFSTYPPMTLTAGSCADSGCAPGAPLQLRFANPVDAKAFDPSSVTVDPALPGGASIGVVGDQVIVSGATQAATSYRVTVAAGLKDTFGQALARDATATVTIGHADPRIYPFPTSVSTLDPMVSRPTVTITTVNQKRFRERVFGVGPGDWGAYQSFVMKMMQRNTYRSGDDLGLPPWPVLADRTVTVGGAGDQVTATALDLSGPLSATSMGGPRTRAVVLIEPIDPVSDNDQWQNRPTATWVQSTTLAVDAINDQSTLRAWVTDLRTGAPVPGAKVTMVDGAGHPVGSPITTDASGLGTFDLAVAGGNLLVATKGTQTAILPSELWGAGWTATPRHDRVLFYVTDDRQTYRPGETVSVKGWVRRQSDDTTMALTTPAAGTVSWSAADGYGTSIGTGTAVLDRLGGFDLTLTIPAGAHLGTADLHVALTGASGTDGTDDAASDHYLTIADFRTPAFEVQTHATTGDPAVRGADLPLQTDAGYYAGGPLAGAPVDWQVRTATASYSPPGWSGYTFGVWTPWWYAVGSADHGGPMAIPTCCGASGPGGTDDTTGTDVRTFHGTTDGSGSDYLSVTVGDLGSDSDGLPVTVLAQATVTDLNRQQIADTATVLVHPAEYYVGMSSDSTFVKQGDKLTVRAIATGIDGAAKAGRPVTVTAARVLGGWGVLPADTSAGATGETLADAQTCTVTSARTPVECTFTPAVGGEYRITATVTDEKGRSSRTVITRWVAGPDGSIDTSVQEQSLTLIPDREQYRPGESATLLVASPIVTGTGLITVSHNGIVSTETFPVSGSSAVVSIPITQALIPGVGISVEVVGTAPRAHDPAGGAGTRPAYATGQIDLTVSTASRSLTVTATPRQSTVKPGGKTAIDVTVTDQAGKPVPGSQFEVVVADEAVLALSGYQLPDPLEAFYPRDRSSWVSSVYGRSTVMLGVPESAAGVQESGAAATSAASALPAAPSAAGGAASGSADTASSTPTHGSSTGGGRGAPGAGSATSPITQRSAFQALALFAPAVTTGADGTATVPITLPDTLTRYRIMVVAVAGDDRFGTGESAITAGLPLTVRPTPPRFLNFGDSAELPVVVQNLTNTPLSADVVLQAANLTVVGAGTGATAGAVGKTVTVPANGRIEVRFPVAAHLAGTASFRTAVVSRDDPDLTDAAAQEFPVYTPATSETFATYGSLPGNTVLAQKITRPTDVIPAFGGLTVTTSSTALAQLSDALDSVVADDHASSDALACQIIAISTVGDVLQAFSTPGLPSSDQLAALVVADIGRLVAMQNDDGGFGYWDKGAESDPFNTVQAVQALLLADKYGHAGTARSEAAAAVTKSLPYLDTVDSKLPSGTSQQARDTINAYAIAVRALAGESSAGGDADHLVAARGDALPMDAIGWLLPVVSAGQRQALLTRVHNAAVDNAGSVTFTQQVSDDAWTVLASQPRTDALILDGLLSVDPSSDLVGKVVNGLMGLQRGGRWDTLQDNTFTLVALRHYYDAYEAGTPAFTAGVWLGDRLAGTHPFTGHTTEQTSLTVPTSELIKPGNTSITVADTGSGRMYYRIGLTTAPSSLSVAALDRGFVVVRSYAGADNPADVTRDAKGVWHIKAGARVRVSLTLVSRSAQSHVALTDPLPAGLEPLNPALATTPKTLAGQSADGGVGAAGDAALGVMPTWYDHQNLRDDRAEAFATWLDGGVYTYSYLALATTPGTFVVPPATGAQVYAPETFGRTATDHVVVG